MHNICKLSFVSPNFLYSSAALLKLSSEHYDYSAQTDFYHFIQFEFKLLHKLLEVHELCMYTVVEPL